MNEQKFKTLTKSFAVEVIRLVASLPKDEVTAQVMGKGLLKAATSVGANYRSACRSRSTVELIAKLNNVLVEADRALYWIELLIFSEVDLVPASKLESLLQEANSIVTMLASSLKTLTSQQHLDRIPHYTPSIKSSLVTIR